MAMPAKNLVGQVFGYLTVLRRAGTNQSNKATWVCQCECGNIVTRESQYLRTKHRPEPRSCGCRHGNQTHKMSRTRPYGIWQNMKRRCTDPKDKDWGNYGARGITVCAAWLDSFDAFWADMAAGYSPLLTLGRKDNDAGYSPTNCQWETARMQANNRRGNVRIQTPVGLLTVAEAAREYGLQRQTIYQRLRRGNKDLLRHA